jgi:two-component system, LytTR family, sensor kinase
MNFRHPFISRPRLAVYYVVFWVITGGITILLKWLSYDIPPGIAAIEFFSLPLMFAIVGTSIWYVIKFSTLENNSVPRIIFFHFIGASVIVLIWLYLGVVLIKLLHPEESAWMQNRLPVNVFLGYILYTVYVIFFYAVNYYAGFKEKLRNEGKLRELVKEAELHALKSQINPHFLFNSLNSISSLTMADPAKAREMVVNLSSLMRYSLKHNQIEKVSFREELQNSKRYLQIEKVRFGKKLNPVFEFDENCLDARMPNMILQPLYENAVKYGVYEATEPVDIITRCSLRGDMLEITILNNYDPGVIRKKGEEIGLRNIRERLQIIYNNPLLMKAEDNETEFKVTLVFPQK